MSLAHTRRLTRPRLENAALAYVQRFASSAAMLQQVLARKLRRALERGELEDLATGQRWVDEIVAAMLAKGYVNDRLYAETKAASLHRRGLGRRRIAATLAQKGLDSDTTQAAMDRVMVENAVDSGDALDRAAAWKLARKRRLGPYRPATVRAEHRNRDMAPLGRAGFDYELARSVIDGDVEDIGADLA